MTYTRLRLACRYARPICRPRATAALTRASFYSSDAKPDEAKAHNAHAGDTLDVFESVFKKQRKHDLAQASVGEDPLFRDAWGRMEEGAKEKQAMARERIREAQEHDAEQEEYQKRLDELEAEARKPKRVAIPDFLMEFHIHEGSGEAVNLMGRIKAKRMSGKGLMFLDIQNEFQKVQVMVSRRAVLAKREAAETEAEKDARQALQDAEEAESQASQQPIKESAQDVRAAETRDEHFKLLRNLLQVGDHVSVTGVPTRTKAGEQTLKATELPRLLSPTMEQIPEKLTDEKTKMAHRHVDMLVNKDVSDTLRLRAEITRYMREHFYSKRFLEYQTPILAQNAGGAVARPFTTRATEFKSKQLAMRVAPELWLKRLVVGGVDKVFEIGPAFRNEGIDATHNPEFTMCEFYSAYSNLAELINETEELICGMAVKSHMLIRDELTALPPLDLDKFKRPFRQVEFIPALESALGMRLPRLTTQGALPELLAVLKLAGISLPGEAPNTLPRLLDRLAAMYLEPLSFNEPLFIVNHPACMSPLSKSFMCPRTYQLVSARAELFMGGRELANMYEEENNPEEQKRKLAEHRQLVNTPEGTVVLGPPGAEGMEEYLEEDEVDVEEQNIETDDHGEASPLDQSYIQALDYGLPPTGGWGCGVERLVMLYSGAERISDVLSFGTLQNVVGLSTRAEEQSKRAQSEAKESKSAEKRRLRAEKAAAESSSRFEEAKNRFESDDRSALEGSEK